VTLPSELLCTKEENRLYGVKVKKACVLLLFVYCCYLCIAVICVLLLFVYCCYLCIAVFFTLDAGLLARSQYSEGPATGHLDTGFSWFPCA